MRVFVLIFNAGTDNEGIHSIRVGNRNQIIMFESEDDATRFALMLEAQDFPTPTIEKVDGEEIKEFCKASGFDWEVVPKDGDLMMPPELNVEETDWQIDDKKQDNNDSLRSSSVTETEQEIADSELDKIRRKLEGLL